MNRQKEIIVTVTYNELGIILDTKAEPRKTGTWIHKHERRPDTWECSECGYRVNLVDGGIYHFCSACGLKMEGSE